jgi:hypothetical protein
MARAAVDRIIGGEITDVRQREERWHVGIVAEEVVAVAVHLVRGGGLGIGLEIGLVAVAVHLVRGGVRDRVRDRVGCRSRPPPSHRRAARSRHASPRPTAADPYRSGRRDPPPRRPASKQRRRRRHYSS